MKKITLCLLTTLVFIQSNIFLVHSCYSSTIFVPRQTSYNPMYENALMLHEKIYNQDWDWTLSVKPFYSQSAHDTFARYFTPCHACALKVREDGSGDVDSLWFQVIDDPFYTSTLSLHPKRKNAGVLLYGAAQLSCNVEVSLDTAIIHANHNVHLKETNILYLGTTAMKTMTQAFANPEILYGKIIECCNPTKTGLDDIQLKFIYKPDWFECFYMDIYALAGIPTGKGSKGCFLFEPLVGSRHAQVGAGADFAWDAYDNDCVNISLLGEAKYRYGFAGNEVRSFDLTANGQWSRYLLLVPESNKYAVYPAINTLTFDARVTPRSSFDLFLAAHFDVNDCWKFELGYDFWYRSAEKVQLCGATLPNVGIADLVGIAQQNPQSASTANISQGVLPGENQAQSDATFIPITLKDINLCSGAAPRSISNGFYGSIGYTFERDCYDYTIGVNGSYEHGTSFNTPDTASIWAYLAIMY